MKLETAVKYTVGKCTIPSGWVLDRQETTCQRDEYVARSMEEIQGNRKPPYQWLS